MIFTENQQDIADKIDSDVSKSTWKEWKWQTGHRIKTIDSLEKTLDINYLKRRK